VQFSSWLRPIAALPVGLFITFYQAHGPDVGLISFAAFAAILGIGGLVAARSTKGSSIPALVALIALVLAVFALIQPQSLMTVLFSSVVAFWASLTGALELYQAKKVGFAERLGRDLLISALLTLGLALLFLIASLDIVSAVGFFGAYLILLGVHWGIAAAGPKTK
jgi:hypothetical protein